MANAPHPLFVALVALSGGLGVGCAEALPEAIMDFEEACIRMNLEEIPPYPDDPHSGYKHVYACHDEDGVVLEAPYPEGTRIVKASRKSGQDFPFLIATAEKQNGEWEWTEYTRNFDGETFLKLPLAQSVCTDCHAAVADTRDWIFTEFEGD